MAEVVCVHDLSSSPSWAARASFADGSHRPEPVGAGHAAGAARDETLAGMDGGFFKRLGRPPLAERLRAAGIREDLSEAAERTAFGRPCDDEIFALPVLLNDDEAVQQLLDGRYRKMVGLLVLTTQRIVFVAKSSGPRASLTLDRAALRSATSRTHRMLSALTLTTEGGDHVVDQILGTQAETFAANALRPPVPDSAPTADPLVELGELRALHQAGAIDDAEYQIRKRRLIDLI